MFFCVLLIYAADIYDSNMNHSNNELYSSLCNTYSAADNTQQNKIFESLSCNDKMQIENNLEVGPKQRTSKPRLDGYRIYERHPNILTK
ncbi:hypothetical protein AAJ76_2400055465 [Vairimorpha ceranae]|uniref:Uncharacterized protein n=1 Tax=Vairimorpha ceranae TaxID=40302 RepID=A0A0F9WR18_9MICR|nr:hypothetical protein AAJ76_2400055465 [Vairimorpha ceranae]KKO75343.1 hypothetical protein AAJ76_2400055465 [Vairimorpha ceranae]